MDVIFEANFKTVGTPDIRIYRVIEDGVYSLVKTDTMGATTETGKYSYTYQEGNALYDYSARMELGTEELNGVYNSIFEATLARAGHGNSGGITYANMTKTQVLKFVEMAKELFQKSLDDLHISIPEDLGQREVEAAIGEINLASKGAIVSINADVKKAIETIAKELSVNITNNNQDIIDKVEKYLKGRDNNITQVGEEIKEEISQRADLSTIELSAVSDKLSVASEGVSKVEGVARKGVDQSVLIRGLIEGLTQEIRKEIVK